MRFSLGFISGAIVGGYIANTMTEDQRSKVADKASSSIDKLKNTSVVSSITNNAGEVSEAAGQRVADVVDAAGDKVTAAVGTNDDTAPTHE